MDYQIQLILQLALAVALGAILTVLFATIIFIGFGEFERKLFKK